METNKQKVLARVATNAITLDILLKGQLRYLSQYYKVLAIASGEEILDLIRKREGVSTIHVKMNREIRLVKDIGSLISLIIIFFKNRPYIVHVNTPKASLLAMIAAKICKVPHRLYTVTGLRFETTTGLQRTLLMFMEKITCFCATKVIPEGGGVKFTLQKHRITSKPLNVILNGNIKGVDINYFKRTQEINRKALKLKRSPSGFIFCFIGRLVKDKGINELVSAFAKVHDEFKDTFLIFVGVEENGLDPLNDATIQLMKRYKSIQCFGFQRDVRPYLAAADALVFPSYREGFPNVVLEAGAMNLPSIVTNVNGSNEIIVDGLNGVIIPPKDEIALYNAMRQFVLDRNDKVKQMANNARKLIETRFEQSKLWEALLKEYESLDTE